MSGRGREIGEWTRSGWGLLKSGKREVGVEAEWPVSQIWFCFLFPYQFFLILLTICFLHSLALCMHLPFLTSTPSTTASTHRLPPHIHRRYTLLINALPPPSSTDTALYRLHAPTVWRRFWTHGFARECVTGEAVILARNAVAWYNQLGSWGDIPGHVVHNVHAVAACIVTAQMVGVNSESLVHRLIGGSEDSGVEGFGGFHTNVEARCAILGALGTVFGCLDGDENVALEKLCGFSLGPGGDEM